MRAKYRALKIFHRSPSDRWPAAHPLLDSLGSAAPWVFYDETWAHVVNRWEFRRALADGKPVTVTDPPRPLPAEVRISPKGLIAVDGAAAPDKWFYLYLDPQSCSWSNYSWKLRLRRLSDFKELQLAFRYQDFYNRYRYRFQDGKLCFDMVVNGQFRADLSVISCPLEIGRSYDVEIRAVGSRFECWVDGRLMSRDYDPENRFPAGPIAVILWEDDGVTPIRAELALQTVTELIATPPRERSSSSANAS